MSIFFIDENQRVSLKYIGSVEIIREYAKGYGAEVISGVLPHSLDVMAQLVYRLAR